MRIELRNIKYAAFASQETSCFAATIYIDGKACGGVRNEGHGGCHFYDERATELKLAAHAKTLPPIVSDIGDESEASGFFTYQPDADTIIDDLLSEELIRRDYRKASKAKILFTKGDGQVYATRKLSDIEMRHFLQKGVAGLKGAVQILNTLPEGEALTIYRRA